jgi:GNAT superfamily N-acetyltransferase
MQPANLLAWPKVRAVATDLSRRCPQPWTGTQSYLADLAGYRSLCARLEQSPQANAALGRASLRRPLWKATENLRLPAVLRPFHQLTEFHSGRPRCDQWLQCEALAAQARGLSRTFVTAVGLKAVGCFTVAAGSVRPRQEKLGTAPPAIPIAVLQWCAVDRSWQGLGLGRALVWDALRRINQAADLLGMRCVLAESRRGSVRAFLAALGFEPALGDGKTMMVRLCDLRWVMDE